MLQENHKNVWVVDTTLQDGRLRPGSGFSREDKKNIASLLSALGVPEIEVGNPSINGFEVEDIQAVVALNLDSRLTAWSQASIPDIEKAVKSGADSIHISFPVSEKMLEVMDRDKKWLYSALRETVLFAGNYFDFISIGAMDAGRARKSQLFEFIASAYSLKAKRIRIADTAGSLTPLGSYQLIKEIREEFPDILIDFYGRNDLGMATANSISAIEGGADCVSVTVNGIGERAGNASLEEVCTALYYGCGMRTGIDLERILELTGLVSGILNEKIPDHKPVVGSRIFQDKNTFLHKSSETGFIELIDPQAFGRSRQMLYLE